MSDEIINKLDECGGAAFPLVVELNGSTIQYAGLNARDWFASQALIGLLSGQYSAACTWNLNEVPAEAFRIADAMLEARRVRP
ncbi:hypothetical protein AB4037_23115 [Labrys sp. KB_33_2]|uniref:hypothetical protein n=1 Tax=Labrys sp. KB_33_2 TaxID=3237479 RepID=UPI003F8F2986